MIRNWRISRRVGNPQLKYFSLVDNILVDNVDNENHFGFLDILDSFLDRHILHTRISGDIYLARLGQVDILLHTPLIKHQAVKLDWMQFP